MRTLIASILFLLLSNITFAEDGHRLWLRMTDNTQKTKVVNKAGSSATVKVAVEELSKYWKGETVTLTSSKSTPAEGYTIDVDNEGKVRISGDSRGILYGTYALLRMQETDALPADGTTLSDAPKSPLRILNHWDNPNGTVERGYAGRSIFWSENGQADLNIIKEYGRANASVGINATVLNNVNAKPMMLSREKLIETKRIADTLRPYGIRVFLSVNFASPKALGGLATADPLDKDVQLWWKNKAKEIYKLIPDFGGFLVKANSEGEPGPMDYGRTHVDGANMLADALLSAYKGTGEKPIVMWRAFVYSAKGSDRASQAYDEFMPYDGQFRDNVIIQIKNGPIDFQPREAVSPLFFSLKKTNMMPEFQITQEYLGESIHSVYLATLWKECLDMIKSITPALQREGVKDRPNAFTPISGVSNIGNDRNWCGSTMAQANWYAFGRLAWNEDLSAEQIAKEWFRQTWGTDNEQMLRVMMQSREAAVHYMMPLGLHHIFAGGHHYGPEPWCAPKGWREDWLPRYYHKADTLGVGFNRTDHEELSLAGSGNTRQYPDSLYSLYNNIETCPEQLLLWFHHASWNHRMHNGETLWSALCHTYDLGVREAQSFADAWKALDPATNPESGIDSERWQDQMVRYDRQAKDAWWWRDACLLYFQQFSGQPLPLDCPKPRHELKNMILFYLNMDNYSAADMKKLP